MTNAKPVPLEATLNRLCSALVSLRRREKALHAFVGNEDSSIDEIYDIENAILDLCGVPEDNTADGNWEKPDLFCRDWLREQLERLVFNEDEESDLGEIHSQVLRFCREALAEKSSPHN